jgi:transposase
VRDTAILYGLRAGRSPYDGLPSWAALMARPYSERTRQLSDPAARAALAGEAEGPAVAAGPLAPKDPAKLFLLPPGKARYDVSAGNSPAALAVRLGGVSGGGLPLLPGVDRLGGPAVLPVLNSDLDAVAAMITNPDVVLSLGDAGAHVALTMDAGQATYVLAHWVRDAGLLSIGKAVRKLTSEGAALFGIRDRGVLAPGAHADVNVIDLAALRLLTPELAAGSVVTWRRAQMVLLSAQKMSVAKIAEVTFTSPDRVRDVIHNFNADGFDSLYPKYAGGRPRTFTLPERREVKKIAKSKPVEHGLPFSTWSLAKLADFLVAEGVVDDISHEGLRVLLREEGVSFQRMKTWKASKDPDYQVKEARVEHLYAIADGEVVPEDDEPRVIWCLDEFGPLNLMPRPGRQWAGRGGKHKDPDREPRPRMRATCNRNDGVRHLFAAYNLIDDKLFGHVKPRKKRTQFLAFCRYLRSLHPVETRIAIICVNYSPHLSTKKDRRVGDWAAANNVEIAYTPTNSSWLNRIEAQFTALRYFALDGTDHPSHKVQASMIRRYIAWRNNHVTDPRLRQVVARANAA